jgi:oligopeptide transport system ATP-binding protein
MSKPILEVDNLQVSFKMFAGEVQAVRGVSFTLNKGEVLAIVGESGSGKSVTAQTIMRLVPTPPSYIKNGSILFDGTHEITTKSERQMEKIRGREMGMIFQDPMTSLNPTMTVGEQIVEGIRKHEGGNAEKARARAVELLSMVGQRVMIAIALACHPKLLIADEPTTALDVTIQAQIMDLLKQIQAQTETSIILITHDLGVVAELAQRVIVMYAGKVVERGTLHEIFYDPRHPYTWGLLRSVPRLDSDRNTELVSIPGTPPDLFAPPRGCAFAARCPYAMKVCLERDPEQFQITETQSAACWLQHPDAPKVERPIEAGVRVHG